MRLVKPDFEILKIDPSPLELIELAGRTCYKTEDKMTCDSNRDFAKMLLAREHESVIEHATATVKFISNRGFTHELVRHRLCSFSQESTRYCNYGVKGVTFIVPWWTEVFDQFAGQELPDYDVVENVVMLDDTFDNRRAAGRWFLAMRNAESAYLDILEEIKDTNAARGVLPNDLKTEIVVTANFREWRHIFQLRTAEAAHPDMKRLMRPLLSRFRDEVPVLFDSIGTT